VAVVVAARRECFSLSLDVSGGDKAGVGRAGEAGAMAALQEGWLYYRRRTRRILKQVYGKATRKQRNNSRGV
jgi:hypothetical protein